MLGHVRSYSPSPIQSLTYTLSNTQQPITKSRTHPGVNTTLVATVARWTVTILWLIAKSFFCLTGMRERVYSISQGSPPLLPTVCKYHMAATCADLWGLWLVPRLTAPLWVTTWAWNPSYRVNGCVPKCVHACVCKKEIQTLVECGFR